MAHLFSASLFIHGPADVWPGCGVRWQSPSYSYQGHAFPWPVWIRIAGVHPPFIHPYSLRPCAGECGRFPARVHLFIQPPSTGSATHGLAEGGRSYSYSAQVAHALALQVQQAFHLFIRACKYPPTSVWPRAGHVCSIYLFIRGHEVARTSGAGPCAPFIHSYGAMKLLGRARQVRVLHLFIHTDL